MTKYWIGVASLNHVMGGVEGGFSQLCHGKEAPLKRMKPGDWLVYYSPKRELGSEEKCQCFTAIGRVKGSDIYPFAMTETFIPYRKDVDFFLNAKEVPLHAISKLDAWQKYRSSLRYGHFEIDKAFFLVLAEKMGLPMKYENK
ncbi:EVE domain-containing protein [Listeria booriae]|uniref:EVE domain-containing protein n=1 Tax=Listeria booriae TaxID=1552123 RepID=UPI001627FBA8|nr:EVE domain-containing protein [Listeria booriae]MBC2323233.1 EVE domain-containing protein [Listeria booriae]MBC2325209.1 EVE domain-containing protein [Listeria booriae]MCD2208655.1 EVE domain-containing protein [Listeria booriae]